MNIEALLEICIHQKKQICIVGGGGKTTLMYMIATYAASHGKKVIVATTTHILQPPKNYVASCVVASAMTEIRSLWEQGQYAVIGKVDDRNPLKLISPDKSLYAAIQQEADLILFEADGAKQRPCKLPADHEPVITDKCDLVIGVMGMTSLGQAIKDCCFRFETEGAWLDVNSSSLFDESLAVTILSSIKGTRKSVGNRDYIVVLNQCDDEERMKKAQVISKELRATYHIDSVCCSLEKERRLL